MLLLNYQHRCELNRSVEALKQAYESGFNPQRMICDNINDIGKKKNIGPLLCKATMENELASWVTRDSKFRVRSISDKNPHVTSGSLLTQSFRNLRLLVQYPGFYFTVTRWFTRSLRTLGATHCDETRPLAYLWRFGSPVAVRMTPVSTTSIALNLLIVV